jgi:DNA-binding MarR family transcriptional regulator
MTLTPHARQALETAILRDLRVSQSTASSIAGRLKTDTDTTTQLLSGLVVDGLVETDLINNLITVYRLTKTGLELIS